MCNPKITTENYNTEQTSLPLAIQEETVVSRERKLTPTFIPYNNQQSTVIFDIQELIPPHHVARVIDQMIESIEDGVFFEQYRGGGRSSYHPKMMTKVILYAYSQKVYSCREIAKLVEENIPMMWLTALQKPDYRTINRFRTEQMGKLLPKLFEEMIHQLIEQKHITMENYFLDGTKIEANANKYTFVWKKATTKFEATLQKKIDEVYQEIQSITDNEEQELHVQDEMSELTAEQKLTQIEEVLVKKVTEETKAIQEETDAVIRKEKRRALSPFKKLLRVVNEDFRPRLVKYQQQNVLFGDRNSYSKTDTDATFMRMKEDHMNNGQLKPGYNIQMATENQFVLFYTVHQRPTDTRCFKPHLEALKNTSLPFPKNVIADAGYGSEENYIYSLDEQFESLIPYNTFLTEQKRSYKKDIRHASNWTYDEYKDEYTCPNNRKVLFKRYLTRTDKNGFTRDFKVYECEDCSDCPLKSQCTKAQGNRQVQYNPVYEELKAKAKVSLWSEPSAQIYARRKIEVESVFGHIKGNRSFRRFSLRGLAKVQTEFGIVAMAHNFLKVAGLHQLLSGKNRGKQKQVEKNNSFFSTCFILGTY
ncbi:IS1182 family transposase [Peribacillus asahii]|uniref:IS1182 family transposase n=2 Tax=Peribacillus asahii TaxID=228899 RepID=UPI00207A4B67|nr:IS1182 family transposase [Peribacillus asahii]USK68404.1 IS1182 family transposase [Peribacillus asahii]USK68532.1 IS1182 family transposase [Peribacillus asahii]